MNVDAVIKEKERKFVHHIACDLDGTLARYEGWVGKHHIGEPVAEVVKRVLAALDSGWKVSIFTARASGDYGPEDREQAVYHVERWCQKHLGVVLPVTAVKSGHFTEFWDDRAVAVAKNKGEGRGHGLTLWDALGDQP